MVKPRIYKVTENHYGYQGPRWVCRPGARTYEDMGVGYTPRDAYIDWLSSLSLWARFRLWVAAW